MTPRQRENSALPTFHSDWAAHESSSLDSPLRSPCRRGNWRTIGQKAGRETRAAGRLRSSRYHPAACSRSERAGSWLLRRGKHTRVSFPQLCYSIGANFLNPIVWSSGPRRLFSFYSGRGRWPLSTVAPQQKSLVSNSGSTCEGMGFHNPKT